MSESTDKTRALLQDALDGVHKAMSEWAKTPLDYTTEDELSYFCDELEKMLEALDVGEKRAIAGIWRIVIDSWPFPNLLRHKIVEAELSFEKLK